MQSDQIELLAAALVKAQTAMKPASMNKINPHFKSKYADLASVIESVRKPLTDNGLSFTQTTHYGAQDGLYLVTTLLHTSGQWLRAEYPLPTNATPQQMGSALTYARRYSLSAITGTAADEDDDGDKAEVQAKKKPVPEPTYDDGKRIAPHEILMPPKPKEPDWVDFCRALLVQISEGGDIDAWKKANQRHLDAMGDKKFEWPSITELLDKRIQEERQKRAP